MRERAGAGVAGAIGLLLAAALLAAPGEAGAKGGRRSGGSSAAKPVHKADQERPEGGLHITIRPGSSSSSSSGGARPGVGPAAAAGRVRAVLPAPQPVPEDDPEEQARRAAAAANYQKAMTEQAAAKKAAAERAEVLRIEAEKLKAQRAAREASEQQARSAREAAAAERKRREQAAVEADVDRVLERARSDYPVLRTAEGEPVLRSILERQKVLQARGLYPATAMVEAVADHSDALRPRPRRETPAAPAAAEAAPDHSKSYGNCRWVTTYTWSCK